MKNHDLEFGILVGISIGMFIGAVVVSVLWMVSG